MNTQNLLILISTLAIAAVGTFFSETVKEVIKKFFSDLSKRQVTFVFIGLMALAMVSPFFIFPKIAEAKKETPKELQPITINPPKKTEAEIIVGGVFNAYKEVKQEVVNNHIKDSIKIANRVRMWVYQIGSPKRNPDDLWDTYEKLKSVPNISVFRESRKSYFLIKDDGYSEKMLNDSLEGLKKVVIDSSGENRISVINLMSYCSSKEKIVQGKNIHKRKKGEIKCYECD